MQVAVLKRSENSKENIYDIVSFLKKIKNLKRATRFFFLQVALFSTQSYLRPCLDLGIFISYLCDHFFFFIFIFIMINRIISKIQTHLFFCLFLEYVLLFLDGNMNEECEYFSNSKSSASGFCLEFASFFANISLALLKSVYTDEWFLRIF